MPPERRTHLLQGPNYEQIIRDLADTVHVVKYRRERCCGNRDYFRLNATLKCFSPVHVDLFHSSAAGYRAQYYIAPAMGEAANRFAVECIGRSVWEFAKLHPKRSCPVSWMRATVEDEDAKVWIHQGQWLRAPSLAKRLLRVERWQEHASSDKCTRKRARWSQLTPADEDRIDLKGGFVTLEGEPLGSLKPTRSDEHKPARIHLMAQSNRSVQPTLASGS